VGEGVERRHKTAEPRKNKHQGGKRHGKRAIAMPPSAAPIFSYIHFPNRWLQCRMVSSACMAPAPHLGYGLPCEMGFHVARYSIQQIARMLL
jgi:hypothetical protein